MSGPFIAERNSQPFDLLQKGIAGDGWDGVHELFQPFLKTAELQPAETVAEFMYGLAQTGEGRAMFEWMMDISLRQPHRPVGSTLEETALKAAVRQGIDGFAEAVLNAIAHGENLIAQKKNPNGARS